MRKEYSRRSLLRVGGPALALGLAGCSSESDSSGTTATSEAVSSDTTTTEREETAATTSVATTDEPECEYESLDPDEPSGTVELVHEGTYGNELNELKETQFERVTDNEIENVSIPPGCFAWLESVMDDEDSPHVIDHPHEQAVLYDRHDFLSDQTGNIDIPACVLPEETLEISQVDGKQIGIPWSAETVALFYNADLVDSPPETLEAMQSIMGDHHEDDGETFGLAYPVNPFYVSGFAQAYGEDIYDEDTDELGIDTDAVERGLRVVVDDLKPYMPSDPGENAQKSVFVNGNAPFLISGSWDIPRLEEQDFELGVTTLPDLPGGGTPRPYTGYSVLFFAKRMDEDPDGAGAARNYARWLASDEEILLELATQGNVVPVHAELRASGRLPALVQGFADQLETAYPIPQRRKMDNVWGPFGDAVIQAYNGNGELRDTLDSAAQEIREEWAGETFFDSASPELALNRLSLESSDSLCSTF